MTVIALAACSNNDGPVRGAATPSTSTPGGSASTEVTDPGGGSPGRAGAAGPANANAPAGANGERTATPHSRGGTTAQSNKFVFVVTTNDPRYGKASTWSYDVVTQSTGDTIDATWTMHLDNPPDRRTLRRSGDALVGIHLPGQAGEYMKCAWTPAPVNIPRFEVGATATIDSTCEHSHAPPPDHHHMTGSVKVTGTREVRFNGKTLTVWIVEREWRHEVNRDRSREFTVRAVGWWSPDLSMIVRSEAAFNQPADVPRAVHLGMSSKLLGLEE